MNIDFELYRIFYVVAKNGNITKAADELNISQPAISKSIRNLEEQLGGQLFVRTKRGVVLTEEGKEFYKYISKAIEYISSAENKFGELINLEYGCIKIGISTTLTKEFLLPYLSHFHKLYPKIDIRIDTNLSSSLIQSLRNGLVDIVILNLKDENYGSDIEIIKCNEIRDCFVANELYDNLFDKEVTLNEISKFPLILQLPGSNTRAFLDDFAKKQGVILKPNIELASYSLVAEFAKIGLGIGYVTKDYISNELKEGKLRIINLKEKIPSRYVGIALSKNHLPNFSVKRLLDIILDKSNL
jgi:DNA-binding transcriptional LysR family regulator